MWPRFWYIKGCRPWAWPDPMVAMDLLQDVVVALVALAAAGILFRRLIGFARPAADGAAPACANCPSAAGSCHTPSVAALSASTPEPSLGVERPLVFVRPVRP